MTSAMAELRDQVVRIVARAGGMAPTHPRAQEAGDEIVAIVAVEHEGTRVESGSVPMRARAEAWLSRYGYRGVYSVTAGLSYFAPAEESIDALADLLTDIVLETREEDAPAADHPDTTPGGVAGG